MTLPVQPADLRAGIVLVDCDKRNKGRRIKVIAVHFNSDGEALVEYHTGKRIEHIKGERIFPAGYTGSRGYRIAS